MTEKAVLQRVAEALIFELHLNTLKDGGVHRSHSGGIWLSYTEDADGRYLTVNDGFLRFWGVRREEVV